MPADLCQICNVEVTAVDDEALIKGVLSHINQNHPEITIGERQVRNYLERKPMLSDDTERRDEIGEVDVVALAPDRVEDVLRFFDRDAFAGNPAWASCYCMAHHIPGGEEGEQWVDLSWEDNRTAIAERIRNGETQGVLAYDNGRLVGWCNASARCQYPDYARGDGADESTGVVTCFVVAPSHRGHGLARRMLEHAVEQFEGMDAVEAHPANDVTWPGAAYRGTVALYEQCGFTVAHQGKHTTVMRKELS